ncbi:DUF1990 family protein [Parasphingorhabdus pacifica]
MGTIVRNALLPVRWGVGMALISWRYLWQTTPLHRTEVLVEAAPENSAPEVAEHLLDERCQPDSDGAGELYHRRFRVRIEDSRCAARELMSEVKEDLNRAAPTEVVRFHKTGGAMDAMRPGDEFVVRMPGPWNGPVRVIECGDQHFRFVTLCGHLEAGQIEFRVFTEGAVVWFEIETWARASSALVNLLYAKLRLAKEMQLNMWVRYCLGVARLADGRARGGVRVDTRCVADAARIERGGAVRDRLSW